MPNSAPKFKNSLLFKILLSLASFLLYFASYPFVDRIAGPASTAFSIIPVGITAWFLGMWAGIIAGLSTFPINILLLNVVGRPGVESMVPGGIPGTVSIVLLAALIGRVRELSLKLGEEFSKREVAEKKGQEYLNIIDVIVVAIDEDGKVSLVNKKGANVLGYPQEEIIGKDWFETFIPREVREKVRSVHSELISGRGAAYRYYENEIVAKGNKRILIGWHNTYLKNFRGQIASTLSSGQDITESKRASLELQEKTHEMEQINDLMIGRELKMEEMKKKIAELEGGK